MVVALGIGFYFAIPVALDGQAREYCSELQKQASTTQPYDYRTQTGFYITKADSEECAGVHMDVDAAVVPYSVGN